MRCKLGIWKAIALMGFLLFVLDIASIKGQTPDLLSENKSDSSLYSRRLYHRIGMEARPGKVIFTRSFLKGDNKAQKAIENSLSLHIKYSFQFSPNSYVDRIYRGAYQGVGFAYNTFGNREELGNPFAFYLFQGARIARITPWLSFNYEWNFGLSCGWKPYDQYNNEFNKVIGSKANAYMNANFYLNWALSRHVELTSGIDLNHFSNGNTDIPNSGLNTVGLKVGLAYNFNRMPKIHAKSSSRLLVPEFPRHISYDLVLFGSWRRKGVDVAGGQEASPHKYTVLGLNFAPMYNLGYKFRVGLSADVAYDGSANVYRDNSSSEFVKPDILKQLALGISLRGEFVMPYFTVGLGLGTNVLHGGGDLNSFYQMLTLKIEVTRSSFIHVGYSLQDLHIPNYLMLGIGFRFHNLYPTFHR